LLLKASHIISKDVSNIPPTAGGRGGVPLATLSNALRWPPINKLSGGPRRRRDPSVRDPRRRAPVAYEFLFPAHRTVLYRIAGINRACNVICSHLLHLPLLGPVTLSVTERTLRVHSLGALHSVSGLAIGFMMGSGQFCEGCGCKLTIRFPGNKKNGPYYSSRSYSTLGTNEQNKSLMEVSSRLISNRCAPLMLYH